MFPFDKSGTYKCIIIYFEKILLNEEDEYAITI